MGQVLIAVGVVGLLFLVTLVAVTALLVRGARRRYHSLRARLLAAQGAPPEEQNLARVVGSAAAASVGSPGWWTVQNHRHRLWRAVTSAEHAVDVARRSEVAVGDLPTLAARLRTAANAVDAVLRASARQGALRAEDRTDCDRIIAAATELREAAVSSLRSDSRTHTDTVVSAVQIEVAALAAGVRAAHR